MTTRSSEMSPDEIERLAGATHCVPALFGYVSGLADNLFLAYVLRHRDNAVVRRVFFSEIEKRTDIPCMVVDAATTELLAAITDGIDRSKNEALLRRLLPRMSMQMRTRAVRTILLASTRVSRRYVLRWMTPAEAPGTEEAILDLALHERDEDALVGIVYRWPVDSWKERANELFEAAAQHPWLQRQIIFKTDDPDKFLDRGAIIDPVTELYVRTRYNRPVSVDLIKAVIDTVNAGDPSSYDSSQRSGLVAWCLGRLGAFDQIAGIVDRSSLVSATAHTACTDK